MISKPKIIKLVSGNVVVADDWNIEPFNVTVKKGFISDGVSVPYIFRWYIHRRGELLTAAIFHDYCYKNAIKTKEFADNAFYYLAIITGVNWIKAEIAYYAVKLFGKGNYKKTYK